MTAELILLVFLTYIEFFYFYLNTMTIFFTKPSLSAKKKGSKKNLRHRIHMSFYLPYCSFMKTSYYTPTSTCEFLNEI